MTDGASVPELERLPPMTHYILGLLRRPSPSPPRTAEEATVLQERHLAHLRRLREAGELISSGPLEEDTALRGVLLFRTGEIARARQLMRDDPLVAGGHLVLDLFTWFAPAGLSVERPQDPPTELTFQTD